ncbi:MAG: hypothetical protein SFT92_01860 [Rickettsiales bacterium]|nr:hypothetical protein [Rickettsiales bacterium]
MTEPMMQKKYATANHPSIHAVVKSLYRFANKQQALERMESLKDHFVTSKHMAQGQPDETLIIWIRGFELKPTEADAGYKGHYALIAPREIENERYTLTATKLESELNYHPQKARPKRRHPDWGHPILRDIKKKRIYFTMEEAMNELQRLHEEYPEVTIPGEHQLLAILFERKKGSKSPVTKYKFNIRALPDGGFMIDPKENKRPLVRKTTQRPPAPTAEGAEPGAQSQSGYFTAMVALKKRKKPTNKPTN